MFKRLQKYGYNQVADNSSDDDSDGPIDDNSQFLPSSLYRYPLSTDNDSSLPYSSNIYSEDDQDSNSQIIEMDIIDQIDMTSDEINQIINGESNVETKKNYRKKKIKSKDYPLDAVVSYKCSICPQVELNSISQLKTHLTGRAHLKTLERLNSSQSDNPLEEEQEEEDLEISENTVQQKDLENKGNSSPKESKKSVKKDSLKSSSLEISKKGQDGTNQYLNKKKRNRNGLDKKTILSI